MTHRFRPVNAKDILKGLGLTEAQIQKLRERVRQIGKDYTP